MNEFLNKEGLNALWSKTKEYADNKDSVLKTEIDKKASQESVDDLKDSLSSYALSSDVDTKINEVRDGMSAYLPLTGGTIKTKEHPEFEVNVEENGITINQSNSKNYKVEYNNEGIKLYQKQSDARLENDNIVTSIYQGGLSLKENNTYLIVKGTGTYTIAKSGSAWNISNSYYGFNGNSISIYDETKSYNNVPNGAGGWLTVGRDIASYQSIKELPTKEYLANTYASINSIPTKVSQLTNDEKYLKQQYSYLLFVSSDNSNSSITVGKPGNNNIDDKTCINNNSLYTLHYNTDDSILGINCSNLIDISSYSGDINIIHNYNGLINRFPHTKFSYDKIQMSVDYGSYAYIGCSYIYNTYAPFISLYNHYYNENNNRNFDIKYSYDNDEFGIYAYNKTAYDVPNGVGGWININDIKGNSSSTYIDTFTVSDADSITSLLDVTPYKPSGQYFSKTVNNIDWSTNSIEITIDLSTCGSTEENILSVGADISNWSSNAGGVFHFYYTKGNNYININYTDSSYLGGLKQNITVPTDKSFKIIFSKSSITINGTSISKSTFTDKILDAKFFNLTSVQIGSNQQSDNKPSNATFDNIQFIGVAGDTGMKIEYKYNDDSTKDYILPVATSDSSGVMSSSDKKKLDNTEKMKVVTSLPDTPDEDTIYFVVED